MSTSSSCCTLPPVQVDYTPKGSYDQVNGLKTYVTGKQDASKVLLFVYDIFGYSPQILQGADMLASQGYKVVMPDFLKGDYATPAMFAGGEEADKKKGEWFSRFPGQISTQTKPIGEYVKSLKYGKDIKLGSIGACWGYKVVVECEGVEEIDAMAGIHPSFIAAEDAEKINVPLALLPSGGEDMDIINKINEGVEAKNKGKNLLKHYPDMPHGWMAARGDFKSDEGKKQFADGYETLAKFFKEHL